METAITFSLSLPKSWAELTTAQQIYVYFLLSEGYDAAAIRSFCLISFIPYSRCYFTHCDEFAFLMIKVNAQFNNTLACLGNFFLSVINDNYTTLFHCFTKFLKLGFVHSRC